MDDKLCAEGLFTGSKRHGMLLGSNCVTKLVMNVKTRHPSLYTLWRILQSTIHTWAALGGVFRHDRLCHQHLRMVDTALLSDTQFFFIDGIGLTKTQRGFSISALL